MSKVLPRHSRFHPGNANGSLELRIFTVRGRSVMLDADLASIYGVATRVLNQAARRNHKRFPVDFMFRLTSPEVAGLRSQFVISNGPRGGRRHAPFAFTEHGAIMLASVLSSPTAVLASIQVVRAFVRLRSGAQSNNDLLERLSALEAKCDKRFRIVFTAIRTLLQLDRPAPKRQIGFSTNAGKRASSRMPAMLPPFTEHRPKTFELLPPRKPRTARSALRLGGR